LLKNKDFDKYQEYEFLLDEKGKVEFQFKNKKHEYRLLNSGKVRWKIATSYERTGKYKKAIMHYREAISYNYKSNSARKKITKLELKIKRGY
ncbi:hypothetical protein ACFL20_06790, partial [Spirochaetota bacterium]